MDQIQLFKEMIKRQQEADARASDVSFEVRRRITEELSQAPEYIAVQEAAAEVTSACQTILEDLFPPGTVWCSDGRFYVVEEVKKLRVDSMVFYIADNRLRRFTNLLDIQYFSRNSWGLVEDTASIEDKKVRKAVETCIIKIRTKGW